MSEQKRALLKQWLANGELRLQPLTFPQRELWETSPVPVGDVANHICCLIALRGFVTFQDCQAALERVVERQEVLRLSFLPGKERPLQMVRNSCKANLRFRELSSAQGRPEAVEELAHEFFVDALADLFEFVHGAPSALSPKEQSVSGIIGTRKSARKEECWPFRIAGSIEWTAGSRRSATSLAEAKSVRNCARLAAR